MSGGIGARDRELCGAIVRATVLGLHDCVNSRASDVAGSFEPTSSLVVGRDQLYESFGDEG